MFGLEYLAAGYLHLAAAQYKCTADAPPEFNVVATGMDYVVDHTRSIQELTSATAGTVTAFGAGATTFTDGLMRGRIATQMEFEWGMSNYPDKENTTCLSVKRITVKIHIDPTVFIAREYKKGSCIYNAVMGHEMKHIYADRKVVNKYTTIIVKGLGAAFKKMGYAHGPVNESQRDALSKQIAGIIKSILTQYSNNMNAERDYMQAQIDTVQEYTRVSNMCKETRAPTQAKKKK